MLLGFGEGGQGHACLGCPLDNLGVLLSAELDCSVSTYTQRTVSVSIST